MNWPLCFCDNMLLMLKTVPYDVLKGRPVVHC